MKRIKKFKVIIIVCAFVIPGFIPHNLWAADYAALDLMFHKYKSTISDFADALYGHNWEKAGSLAEELVRNSESFKKMADTEYEQWIWNSQGMITHSNELVNICKEKNNNDAYFVSIALFVHLNHIIASTPLWLRDHVGKMIGNAWQGVQTKDMDKALFAGEAIHLSAHDLSLSGQIAGPAFANTRWIKDARRMHILGDEFQEAVQKNDWKNAKELLQEIEKIYKKIAMSFKKQHR